MITPVWLDPDGVPCAVRGDVVTANGRGGPKPALVEASLRMTMKAQFGINDPLFNMSDDFPNIPEQQEIYLRLLRYCKSFYDSGLLYLMI